MTEDWAAVARAIDQRVSELGMRQRELAKRSHVSQATVRELQHNTVQRRRSARTLEALSLALSWHPQHLLAVLEGRRPPAVGEPVFAEDDVPTRLDAIERHLREITRLLDEMNSRLGAGTDRDGKSAG
ncbi:XRE family transcriptional regulator [Saccharopolyspora sp. K220]|uniref:helix-turn-helix domain-containing protein n=1 Tax=Saccharopolyspora soli TaxID=2926618 RepID=UPI001F598BBC|nr:helix-turn-helix domain-containing protein [Saccharopolyspora soli]MCI2421832.1 XRE family transcriptional regulator [Saccharopolyspora soli]